MKDNEFIEITVKVQPLGEFNDFKSWIKNLDEFMRKNGIMHKVIHIDRNGYSTNGYDLKNTKRDSPYPVKSYVLIQDTEVKQPVAYKSPSNN